MTDMSEVRRRGLDKMKEVYGWDMPDMPGDFYKYTIEHLFGTIWTRPELSLRDRRLLLLGAVSALGLDDILEIQTTAALSNGELSEDELREVAIFWGMNIRINAIAPGPTDTEATRTVTPPEYVKELVKQIPLSRMGTTDDMVGMCLFLLSDQASWITGQIFNVDGGQIIRS